MPSASSVAGGVIVTATLAFAAAACPDAAAPPAFQQLPSTPDASRPDLPVPPGVDADAAAVSYDGWACQPDEVRCQGPLIQWCSAGAWTTPSACADGSVCSAGACGCLPECAGKACGPDGCDGVCGACPLGHLCEDGRCVCVADCAGRACGTDGCGGSCGSCGSGQICAAGQCACAPACDGLTCGADGCGGSCGDCAPGTTCVDGSCVCAPHCGARECGADGCGGTCGACGDGLACMQGHCACLSACADHVCGPDGCGGSCGACGADAACGFDGQCHAPIFRAVLVLDAWSGTCSAFGASGADIDAVGLYLPDGTHVSWWETVEGGLGASPCPSQYDHPEAALGPPTHVGADGLGYASLEGGWIAGLFGDGAPIVPGHEIEVVEFGLAQGGSDEPYDIYLATDLGCPHQPDPSTCMKLLTLDGFGTTRVTVE